MHQADIEQVLRVNLLGPILLTRLVARTMLVRREGRLGTGGLHLLLDSPLEGWFSAARGE